MRGTLLARFVVAVALAGALFSAAGAATAQRSDACPSVLAGQTDLGRLAFISRGRLQVVQPATCRVRTLVSSGVQPPLRWSADGRFLAYGTGWVVPATGGTPTRPLGPLKPGWGSASPGWVWSPAGERLAGVTSQGGVAVGGPGREARQLWPQRWGATSIAWSPGGRTLAVARSRYPRPPYDQQVWLLQLATGRPRLLWHLSGRALAPPWISGFSPDGRWLLAWEDSQNSSSLAADGVPLVLIGTSGHRAVTLGPELMYGDFVSWCGGATLAYVHDNGGREVSLGDRIYESGPPAWPTTTPADSGSRRHLSYISPTCGQVDGQMLTVATAGHSSPDLPFGHEHRSLYEIRPGGNWTPLGRPAPRGSSDELPMLSSDGRWLAFIRTGERDSSGQLYLLPLAAQAGGHLRRLGPIADLGSTANYYGHFGWGGQVAWYSR